MQTELKPIDLERLADQRADKNDIEGAWYLRGYADALDPTLDVSSDFKEGGMYNGWYRRGWNDAKAGRPCEEL